MLTKIEPTWRTSTVIELCEQMRTDNDYSRLPVLADALMDAGCDSSELLEACHKTAPGVLAQRLTAIVLSDELAMHVRCVEEFAGIFKDKYPDEYTESFSISYEKLMQVAGNQDKEGQRSWREDYIHLPFDTPDEAYRGVKEFWEHFAAITGKEEAEGREDSFFSCAC